MPVHDFKVSPISGHCIRLLSARHEDGGNRGISLNQDWEPSVLAAVNKCMTRPILSLICSHDSMGNAEDRFR